MLFRSGLVEDSLSADSDLFEEDFLCLYLRQSTVTMSIAVNTRAVITPATIGSTAKYKQKHELKIAEENTWHDMISSEAAIDHCKHIFAIC